MYTYECWDIDRTGNWYRLKVRVTYNKKGERSDTVILVKHLGKDVGRVFVNQGWVTVVNACATFPWFAKAQQMPPEEFGGGVNNLPQRSPAMTLPKNGDTVMLSVYDIEREIHHGDLGEIKWPIVYTDEVKRLREFVVENKIPGNCFDLCFTGEDKILNGWCPISRVEESE